MLYVELAHRWWNAGAKVDKTEVLFNVGCED
jgi:hypothetical protein